MQDIVASTPTILPFTALNRISGEGMEGARVSIRRVSTNHWWNGGTWEDTIAYNAMTHVAHGAHSYEMTFPAAGEYQLIYTSTDPYIVNYSEVVTVYPESRLGDADIDSMLRGEGANVGTVTVTGDGSTPVADADIWVTIDEEGLNVVAGTMQTNSVGEVTFWLDTGVTYYIWAQKDGQNFENPYEVEW